MSVQALTIPTLTMLAGEINDAHQEVEAHAKGMLLEAKRAGDALLAAKKECQHGTFKAWVEENCSVSYRTAAKYMKVAKIDRKSADLGTFQGGVDAFLKSHAQPRKQEGQPPKFTEADAEYAEKLHAMATRGATEGEGYLRTSSRTSSAFLATPAVVQKYSKKEEERQKSAEVLPIQSYGGSDNV